MTPRPTLIAALLALAALPALAQTSAQTPALFKDADLKAGEQFIKEHKCEACHARRMGGDGSSIYKPTGRINNPGALHVYDDPEQVFREIWRVLRPGGIYVGSTFAEAPSIVGKVVARAAGIRRFAPSELRSWLQRLGFADYEDLRVGGAIIFRARRP